MELSLDVVERVLQLLQHGRRNSTYKHAVLIGLMDLCLEKTDPLGEPPSTVTTRELAEKVIQLYWPQVRPWTLGVSTAEALKQNQGKRAVILRRIDEVRREVAQLGSEGALNARQRVPDAYRALVDDVEWTLIEMPLPRLQRIDGYDTGWLYAIAWDNGSRRAKRTHVRAYQRHRDSPFDNRIHLKPEAASAFVRLHGLLRPFVEQQWAQDVARMNRLEESRLYSFLFSSSRTALRRVREPLLALQEGRCFYCGEDTRACKVDVDHFLPWSRHPDNGLHNLVVAHAKCNGYKSDFLAGVGHLRRWRVRNQDHASDLEGLAGELRWDLSDGRTLGVARALYLRLPEETRLWIGPTRRDFEVVRRTDISAVLSPHPPNRL